jgi:WD40 repeat protein/DNA-binding SARP family transcriptional activator
MQISVLGPVEVSVGGQPVAIGAGKPRALLALLALHEGMTVSTDRLVEGLWGQEPPSTAHKMVQLYVSQLRKALANGGDNGEIVTRGRGYELRLGNGGLDARRFEQLITRGMPREALRLWRGAPLADVADEPFAGGEIRRLEELRLRAIELAVDTDLAGGRHLEVVGEIEAVAAEEPLRERLHAQRMLALYRSGRQADALEAYRQYRGDLVEAIGAEPGPELRHLHEAILRQDPELELTGRDTAELPPELDAGTVLVGREAELDSLREHWRHAHGGAGRLVLIVGQQGIGKTRLAAELAVELHRDRATVLYASGAGAPEATRAVLASARSARRPTLVVLDDADRADDDVRAAVEEFAEVLHALPVLVVAATGPGATISAEATLTLAPLDADEVAAIARSYTGAHDDAEVPVARLVEASGGVPQQIHRAANEWARTQAAKRLDAAASRAASERAGLRAAEDDLAGSVVERQAAREHDAQREGGVDGVMVCPFKGLASFDVDDAGFFFGRERLIAEMVARLAGAPLMGIIGPSGSGKSSALRAGLLPALAGGVLPGSKGWALALLRPGEHPQRALKASLAAAGQEGRLVVAVDQFEEVFTACRDESERVTFVDALLAGARDPRRRAIVLIAIRADFYGRCAAYAELWRLLGANQVTVGPMRRDELRRAIELPARRAGLEVESELTDALIADVEGEPGALPLMSTSLLELWQRRDGRRLRLVAYEQAGRVDGAVARLAESTYARLDPAQRDIARRILLRLAGEGEGDAVVRRRVGFDELPGEGVAEVLDALADDRLVTVTEGAVEVAHEALLREWPRLRGWLEDDAQGRRVQHELGTAARAWDAGGRDPGELYRGARLAAALDWSSAHEVELNPTERAFLDLGRAASERSQRRLRAVLGGVVGLLVLAVIAGALAFEQRGHARDEATAADAQRLGARALLENDLDAALLLARQGVALDNSVRTRGSLLAALSKSPAAIGVLRGAGERMWTLALSPDERTLVAGDPAGNVFFFDTRTRRRVATFRPTDGNAWIVLLAYSPNGRRLAIAHDGPRGNVVAVLDTRSRRVLRTLTPPRHRYVSALRYSADGTLDVMTVTRDGEEGPALFTRHDARTARRLLGPVRVNRRDTSPLLATSDGRRLITAGDGEVTVRDAASLRPLERFPVRGASAPLWSTAFALSADDRTVAIGEADGAVRFLDLQTGTVRTASGRHEGAVTSSQFTADGRWLITASEDGKVTVWDVRQAAAGETLSGHANGVQSLRVTRNGRTLYTAGLDGAVFIWDLAGTRRLGRPFKASAGGDQFAAALSSDGRLFARGQNDGAITITDTRTLAPRAPFRVGGGGAFIRFRFVPGSRLMVVGREEGFLALVDSDSGSVLQLLRGHRGAVYTPGISADGSLLVTGSDDNTVRFWSLPNGQPIGAPLRFRRQLYDTQLSPDGRWVTVSLIDHNFESGTVEVWDARSRRRVRSVRVAVFVGFARFSPDGRLLAVGNRFGRTQVWSTANWRPVTRWLGGDASGIITAHISPNGRTLATGSDTGIVQLWDIHSGQALGAPLPGGSNVPVLPFFTPDGTRLIASYQTGRAYFWDIRTESLTRHACQVAGRRLTRAEWEEFLPGRDYDPAC